MQPSSQFEMLTELPSAQETLWRHPDNTLNLESYLPEHVGFQVARSIYLPLPRVPLGRPHDFNDSPAIGVMAPFLSAIHDFGVYPSFSKPIVDLSLVKFPVGGRHQTIKVNLWLKACEYPAYIAYASSFDESHRRSSTQHFRDAAIRPRTKSDPHSATPN